MSDNAGLKGDDVCFIVKQTIFLPRFSCDHKDGVRDGLPRKTCAGGAESNRQRQPGGDAENMLHFGFIAGAHHDFGQQSVETGICTPGKTAQGVGVDAPAIYPGIVGLRVGEILAPYGRVFPPDPASKKSAMVGGIVANNASGMK